MFNTLFISAVGYLRKFCILIYKYFLPRSSKVVVFRRLISPALQIVSDSHISLSYLHMLFSPS